MQQKVSLVRAKLIARVLCILNEAFLGARVVAGRASSRFKFASTAVVMRGYQSCTTLSCLEWREAE